MDKPTCPAFDPAHANDPAMVVAHDLSHSLICDHGGSPGYRVLGELLRADMAAGAPLPTARDIEALVGLCEDDPEDAADIERVDRLYSLTVARINEEF